MQLLPDIHIHIHNAEGKEILHELHTLKQLIMATKEQFQAALAEMRRRNPRQSLKFELLA